MKRWIRPQGVVVFVVLLIVVAGLAFFLSGTIVKRGIEKAGTAVVGARVDVAHARLSLSPLGLALTDLQVTNPGRPMENIVQVKRIAFNMDSGALLRRKLLVEEMALEGMAFNTPRKRSGAVTRPSGADRAGEEEGFKLPDLQIPPVSEILAREELVSVQRSNALREKAAAVEKGAREARGSLPDKAKVDEYQKRLDTLLSGTGLSKARLEEAKALQKEIRGQRDKVQAAEDQVAADLSSLRGQMQEARGSVGEDVRRLKEKYALTPGGLANMTRFLFGERVGVWADRGVQGLKLLSAVQARAGGDPRKAKPPRGLGIDVPLRDRMALPDFWVKRAALSLALPDGTVAGEARDLSSDQALLKRPATFEASGRDLPSGVSLAAGGTLDHTDPGVPKEDFRLEYDGWKVADIGLSESESLPVILRRGVGTLSGKVTVKGEVLQGVVRVNLASVVMEAGGTGDSSLAHAMRTALQGVRKISITANVGGTLAEPQVRLSSDLEGVLKDAVGQATREEAARLEADLRKGVQERTGPALAEAEASLKSLEAAKEQLRTVRAGLEEALKTKAAVKAPF